MTEDIKHASTRIKAVYTLWTDWAISFGAITACILLSGYLIPKTIMPGIVLIIAWILNAYSSSENRNNRLVCSRLGKLVARAMIFTAAVMIIALFANNIPFIRKFIGPENFNSEIPYITSLIIFPIVALTMLWGLMSSNNSKCCRHCRIMRGHASSCDLLGNVFRRQARQQLWTMLWITAALSVIDWSYYLIFYINSNINTPDKFFFFIVPLVTFILSLISLGSIYHGFISEIRRYFMRHQTQNGNDSKLRYLVLNGDRMLLAEMPSPEMPAISYADTPAQASIPFREEPDDKQAREIFSKLSGCDNFTLRPLYTSTIINGVANIFHYAVLVDSKTAESSEWKLGNMWTTLDEIDRMLKSGILAPELASELNRIFTVTMAWKTYDRNGRRLYPIKNYHPTFRLRDFGDWDVDFGDTHWLSVAADNQDRPFFGLRKFIRKITGLWVW